jgi:hypothetical protein
MAQLTAIHDVGESLALLLQRRRALLGASDQLGPVPASEAIVHRPLSEISASTPPSSGLSISCFHVGYSEHAPARSPARDPATANGISLELRYLVASWSATSAAELAFLSWAMLELSRHPILDRSMLVNPANWDQGETLQIAPEEGTADELFQIWGALRQKYRLSALFRVRVVRIGYGPAADGPPVVASRLQFEHGDIELNGASA